MTEECTTPAADTSTTLPPVECTSWCQDGNGHTTAWHPQDQACMSETQRVSLLRQEPLTGFSDGSTMLDYLSAYLIRERFENEAFVQLGHNDQSVASLTQDEALELGQTLIALVETARRPEPHE